MAEAHSSILRFKDVSKYFVPGPANIASFPIVCKNVQLTIIIHNPSEAKIPRKSDSSWILYIQWYNTKLNGKILLCLIDIIISNWDMDGKTVHLEYILILKEKDMLCRTVKIINICIQDTKLSSNLIEQ